MSASFFMQVDMDRVKSESARIASKKAATSDHFVVSDSNGKVSRASQFFEKNNSSGGQDMLNKVVIENTERRQGEAIEGGV
jgi:hypothetical protein